MVSAVTQRAGLDDATIALASIVRGEHAKDPALWFHVSIQYRQMFAPLSTVILSLFTGQPARFNSPTR